MKHKKSLSYKLGISILIVSSVGCSTASVRMLPGEGGMNRVVVRDITKDGAEEAAVKSAHEFCKDRQKIAIFLKDNSKYTGTMDETTRNTIHKASQVAGVLGGVGAIPQASRTAGAVLGTAGTAGYMMTSDRDYEAEVHFRCDG